MNEKESRDFLKGQMSFTPERMMRYIRSRARLSTDEDIEDILQNALILVTKHFDPNYKDANLSLYCLSACNKAIAQNLERYHKINIKKATGIRQQLGQVLSEEEKLFEGQKMQVKTIASASSYEESTTNSQWRTTSLDTLFNDERTADDFVNAEQCLMASGSQNYDMTEKMIMDDLISQIMTELPSPLHQSCFVLKYLQGFKREDVIACLKMDAKSIDTVDKKIVRTLKSFKEKLDRDDI